LEAESSITRNWKLSHGDGTPPPLSLNPKPNIRDKWDPPPENHIKMNFDSASKGNMVLSGVGGIIRD
jgi:hypothetical protein